MASASDGILMHPASRLRMSPNWMTRRLRLDGAIDDPG
jgi:hypothetical protein